MNTYSGKSFSKVGFTHHAKYSYNSSFFLERYLKKVRTKYSFLRMWRLFSSGNWETFVIDFDIAAVVNVVGVKLGKIFGGARWLKIVGRTKNNSFRWWLDRFSKYISASTASSSSALSLINELWGGFHRFWKSTGFIVLNAVDLALLNA